jgi:hypothetical protein
LTLCYLRWSGNGNSGNGVYFLELSIFNQNKEILLTVEGSIGMIVPTISVRGERKLISIGR